jgi:hypothetical protein
VASFASLLFGVSIYAQPLNIVVSSAQYTTYVEARGWDTNYPPASPAHIIKDDYIVVSDQGRD